MFAMNTAGRLSSIVRALRNFLLFALLWWVLTGGGASGSWAVGLPVAALAALLSLYGVRADRSPWRLHKAAGFAVFFLRLSLQGGIDIARRVIDPRLPIAPGLIAYRSRLPPGPPRIVAICTINLLPGTLVAEADGADLTVHVVDAGRATEEGLHELEARIGAMFGARPPGNAP